MRKIFATLAVLSALTSAASAETWQVTQGEGSESRSEWTLAINGNAVTGTGILTQQRDRPVKFKIGGQLAGGVFTLTRSGEGVASCIYVGSDQRPHLGGAVICGADKTRWHAVRQR
jgi:hypothetical protein